MFKKVKPLIIEVLTTMQFEGRRRNSQIPNLTPLIDIVFLLLVFFMLTSHFVRDEVLAIDLPEADSGSPLKPIKQIEVIINENGEYSLNSQIVSLEQLEQSLTQQLHPQTQQAKVVRIRGDANVDLGIAIGAFDAARKAGASSVDIVTIEHKPNSNNSQ